MSRNASKSIHKVGNEPGSARKPQPAPSGRADLARPRIAGLHESAGNRAVGQMLGEGTPLDAGVRADMEARFGESFSEVRIHDDDSAHGMAERLGAKACAVGDHIAFADGRYAPHDSAGRQLLAHELAHVVQQRKGDAAPAGTKATLEGEAADAATAVAGGRAAVHVQAGSPAAVMLDRDDDRPRKRGKGLDDDPAGGRERHEERQRAKKGREQRDYERSRAGKDEAQIAHERSAKELNRLEQDAKKPGAKHRSRKTKEKDLKRFEEVSKDAAGSWGEKNRRKGAFHEAQSTPQDVAGAPQEKWVGGGRPNPGQELHPGKASYAQPDYSIHRRGPGGKLDRLHVNLKSDKVHMQSPSKGRATAKHNTEQAIRNAKHLPADESIVLDYAHTPPEEVQHAMLEQHFRAGSPISEVRFGTTTYRKGEYRAPAKPAGKPAKPRAKPGTRKGTMKSGGKKAPSRTKKPGTKRPAAKDPAKRPAGEPARRPVQERAKRPGVVEEHAPQPKSTTRTAPHDALPEPKAIPVDPPKAAPLLAPKGTPMEIPKAAPGVKPPAASEVAPRVGSPVGPILEGAGWLGTIPAIRDIGHDLREGHLGTAAAKAALVRASFVSELAPPLLAGAVISKYWGEEHETITRHATAGGEFVEGIADRIPGLRSIPYAPKVLGAIEAANIAVNEATADTVIDMGESVVEGAEWVWDELTEPPFWVQELQRREREDKERGD